MASRCPLNDPVHRASCDLEDVSDLDGRVLPSSVEGYHEGFLALAEFGLLAAEPAFSFGQLHAFTRAGTDEVAFKFRDHGQDVEE